MKQLFATIFYSLVVLAISSCSSVFKPSGWPVTVAPSQESVDHMKEHVKFVGADVKLTKQEKALLTFLSDDANIAQAIGKKNVVGSHIWSAAEVYRVDPGLHVSVLCENGYQQTAIYFHYDEEEKTWSRVNHLGENHSRGVPAVIVQ